MTDILTEQAAIKARRQTTRDTSGQFIRPDKALEIRVAGERMKARLKAEVPAAEHARGVVWEDGHYRALPNARKGACAKPRHPDPADFPLLMEMSDAA